MVRKRQGNVGKDAKVRRGLIGNTSYIQFACKTCGAGIDEDEYFQDTGVCQGCLDEVACRVIGPKVKRVQLVKADYDNLPF